MHGRRLAHFIPRNDSLSIIKTWIYNSFAIKLSKINYFFTELTTGPLEIRSTKQVFQLGDNLEIMCSNPGTNNFNQNRYSWSKLNGNLLPNIQRYGSMLKIYNVQMSNRGVYRCTLQTNYETKFADYVIDLQGSYKGWRVGFFVFFLYFANQSCVLNIQTLIIFSTFLSLYNERFEHWICFLLMGLVVL